MHMTNVSEVNCSFQGNLSFNIESNSTFTMGWSRSKRHFSRFNYRQQKYIYELFIEGETTGKKTIPEKEDEKP